MNKLSVLRSPHANLTALWCNCFDTTILSASIFTSAIKFASAGLSYAMFVLIANALSADEFGKFVFGFSLSVVFSVISGFGLATAILRFIPQYHEAGQADLCCGFLIYSGTLSLIFSIAVTGLVTVASYIVEASFGGTDLEYIRLSSLLIPLLTMSEVFSSVLRSMGSLSAAMLPRDVVWRAILCLACIWIADTDSPSSAEFFLKLSSIALFFLLCVQLCFVFSASRKKIQFVSPKFNSISWSKTTWPMWGAASIFVVVQQFDVVLLGCFLPSDSLGSYFAALRSASLVSLMLLAGNLVSAPLISRYYHSNDRQAVNRLMRLLSTVIAGPSLLFFAFLVVFGRDLLGVFDASFVAAYPVLIILGFGFAFDAATGPTGYLMQMIGKERQYLAIVSVTYLAAIVLQCLLIPIYGVYGAAVPTALGVIVSKVLVIRAARRDLRLHLAAKMIV